MGWPTVFIRTTGCNLRCTYCDTKYSYYEGEFLTLDSILSQVKSHPARHVCITGGEPLLQKNIHELMRTLCDLEYVVSLETSGSKSIQHVDPRVKIILDVKTPHSGAADTFLFDNLKTQNKNIEFKFVICSESDFEWSENFCRQYHLNEKFLVLYSPSYEKIDPQWLAEKILHERSSARLQLQLHKYIWSSNKRGV